MPDSSGCYSSQEIADRFGVQIHVARRVIDRLKLGCRIGRNRIVFTEELPKLTLAFEVLGYLSVPDPVQSSEVTDGATRT